MNYEIKYFRKASNRDTMDVQYGQKQISTEIKDAVEADESIGKDVKAYDVVMSESIEIENNKDEKVMSKPELISCKLGARLNGYPGDYSIWSVTKL